MKRRRFFVLLHEARVLRGRLRQDGRRVILGAMSAGYKLGWFGRESAMR